MAHELGQDLELFKHASGLCFLSLPMFSDIPTTVWDEIPSLIVSDTVHGKIGNVVNHPSPPGIKELVLREYSGFGYFPLSSCTPPRLCTSISTLKLELHENENSSRNALVDTVFSSFTFPSLSCLVIMTGGRHPYREAWPKATLGSFLHRSSCVLTKFEVRRISVTDTDLITALNLMPSLVNLYVDDTPPGDDPVSPITPRFIRSLHGLLRSELNPSSSALVPELRELRLTFNGLEFDDSAFIDMVSSRWFPDALGVGLSCLRVVTLQFNARPVDEVVYRPLDCLDEAGMMVVVVGKDG
ncbi:hypothetical protein BDP27DRAFT_1437885 [Rhodocollybia butyracea]|uniref:Uncharacterized protein n=1 Tax=Rhodocollybia butyracea TaxID=206335 RepID=A0A9P5P3P2_9AGAR|nr:hypothetical protein BDP27DRAFT_1437885 [Rhodocollybia butyracea]